MKKLIHFFLLCLFLFLFPYCGSEESQTSDEPAPQTGFYCEFFKIQDLRPMLDFARKHGFIVDLALPPWRVGEKEIAEIIKSETEKGLKIRAWVLLPYEEGYWPGENNFEKFFSSVQNFIKWDVEEDLNIKDIVVDLETSYQKIVSEEVFLRNGKLDQIVKLLLKNKNEFHFNIAIESYSKLINNLHSNGFKVNLVTYPVILDDLPDGDFDLEDIFNIPAGSPSLPWDEAGFMVYTTFLDKYFKYDKTDFVYAYSLAASNFYTDRAMIALGLTRDNLFTPQRLKKEISAIYAAGIKKVMIYSLEGIFHRNDFSPEEWATAIKEAESQIPSSTSLYSIIHSLLKSIDKALNNYH